MGHGMRALGSGGKVVGSWDGSGRTEEEGFALAAAAAAVS